jgi:4'-phosphopantetheinyl transferase EntD
VNPNPARPAPWLAHLFSPGVAAAELREDADASLLYPVEAASCSGFAPKRIADFAGGRLCARRALADLGIAGFPIAVKADRSPRWPPGIAGSISHTAGYRCAVAAPEHLFGSIGIDVEIVGGVTPDIDALVFTPAESAFLSKLSGTECARAATIVFSAKEAFYKCQYAIASGWLDFHDVTIELTPDESTPGTPNFANGSFHAEASGEPASCDRRFVPDKSGRFSIVDDLVATGIAWKAVAAAR